MSDDKTTPADASSQSAAHDWLLGVAIGGYTGAEATHAQTLLAALAAERDRADRLAVALEEVRVWSVAHGYPGTSEGTLHAILAKATV